MRALGLDLGSVRIGVALSDSRGTLASPYGTIVRTAEPAGAQDAIAVMAEETGARVVVVGLPLSMDGRRGPAAKAAEAEAASLRGRLEIPVELWDERMSTLSAARAMRSAGRSSRRQSAVIDSAAAAVLLQAWLDAHSGGGASL